MTLLIATATSEGIVVTADSRTSYVNRSGLPRIATDTASKILQVSESAVIATSGPAFFTDGAKLRNIQSYLEDFRDGVAKVHKGKVKTIGDLASELDSFCQTWLLRIAKEGIEKYVAGEKGTALVHGTISNLKLPYSYLDVSGTSQSNEWGIAVPNFIVAGRDSDGSGHAVAITPFQGVSMQSTTDVPQIIWWGQSEVLSKLFTGNDPFVISTATMTVQDAIDFSIVLTRMTENIHKFSDGTQSSQGGLPGVGGAIDVAFIPIKRGKVQWLSQKKLHTETSIDSTP